MNTTIVLSAFGDLLISNPLMVPGHPETHFVPHCDLGAVWWRLAAADAAPKIKHACFKHTGRQLTTPSGIVAEVYELVSTE